MKRLDSIKLPDCFTSWAIKQLRELHANKSNDRSFIFRSLQNSHNAVQTKIDKLTDAMLEGLIDKDEFKQRKDELLGEQHRLSEKLRDTDQQAENWLDKLEKAFDFAKSAKDDFKNGLPEDKRRVAIGLGTRFILNKNHKLVIETRPVWEKFAQASICLKETPGMCEPQEFLSTKEKTPAFTDVISSWQGR